MSSSRGVEGLSLRRAAARACALATIAWGASSCRSDSAPISPAASVPAGVCSSRELTELGQRRGAGGAGLTEADQAALLGRQVTELARQAWTDPSGELAARIGELLRARRKLLQRLVQSDPGVLLQQALPEDALAWLPADARGCVERRVSVSGKLQIRAELRADASGPGYSYALEGDDGVVRRLRFAGEPPRRTSGTRVRVQGVLLPCASPAPAGSAASRGGEDEEAFLKALSPQAALAGEDDWMRIDPIAVDAATAADGRSLSEALPLSGTTGPQSTLAILVNFSDSGATAYTSTAGLQDVVFNQVDAYFREASNRQAWLTGAVAGPYTIPVSSTICDPGAISRAARAAAQADGKNLGDYSHYVYAFPRSVCGWLGLGTIGGSPSEAWIADSLELHTVSHELGHNLGLFHARSIGCGPNNAPPGAGQSCYDVEYGDTTSSMGNYAPGHFTAYQKEQLRWLGAGTGSPPVQQVMESGTYPIEPFETFSMQPKALKILKATDPSTGVKTYLYVEYRTATGFDRILATASSGSNLTQGVVVHTGQDKRPDSSYLLNPNYATTPSFWKAALGVGSRFTDPESGIAVELESRGSSGAAVTVTLPGASAPPPCVRQAPEVLISGGPGQAVPAGTLASYVVTVTNRDSPSCGLSSFRLSTAALPAGWSASFSNSSITRLAPQASGSVGLRVSSPSTGPVGSQSVDVSASNTTASGYETVSSAVYEAGEVSLDPELRLSVALDGTVYRAGEEILLTVSASADGLSAEGASYSLLITDASGATTSKSGVIGAEGAVTYVLSAGSCSSKGSYQVRGTATLGGKSASSSASFYVE